MNFGHERAKAAFARMREALEKEGVTTRYKIDLVHLEIESTDPLSIRALLAREAWRQPDVIIAPATFIAEEARVATATIPIVFASRNDPVEAGLITAFDDHDTNMVGLSLYLPIDWKRAEQLREVLPKAKRVGIIADTEWVSERESQQFLADGMEAFGIEWRVLKVNSEAELRDMVAAEAGDVDAWYVTKTFAAGEFPELLVRTLDRTGKPTFYPETRFVELGGLLSYDAIIDEPFRIFARQIGLVLSGVAPSRIPVVRPRHFELAVNTRTAARLGLRLDPALIARADRVL